MGTNVLICLRWGMSFCFLSSIKQWAMLLITGSAVPYLKELLYLSVSLKFLCCSISNCSIDYLKLAFLSNLKVPTVKVVIFWNTSSFGGGSYFLTLTPSCFPWPLWIGLDDWSFTSSSGCPIYLFWSWLYSTYWGLVWLEPVRVVVGGGFAYPYLRGKT